jgi:hypothetical protein
MNVLNFISPSDRYHFYREALFNFDFLSVYIVGKSFVTSGILWYVPFIMFIYLLSPIFLSYSKLKVNIRVYIFLLSMLVSLLLFRTHKFEVFSVVHNVVYFLPFYLLGILSSQSENTLQLKINNLTIIFLIILSLTMSYISVLNPLGILKSLDLMLIQKLSFCIVFISVLKNINSNIINVLAKNSYGIFFIHTIILYLGGRILSLFNLNYKTESFIIFLMISNLVLFISLQVVVLVKRILGSKSKFIIGV